MSIPSRALPVAGESLATPFEAWCASVGLHPEDWRAWPMFEATMSDGTQVV